MKNAFTIPKQSAFAKEPAQQRKIDGSKKGGRRRAAAMDIITATYIQRKQKGSYL